MKLNYLILFPIACIGLSISPILAQNPLAQTDNFEIQKSIYQKAKSYNDPNVAITALYNMVAIQPENILLKDSLMKEYFAISQWAASYMVSREILTLEPNNLIALEISCVTLQNLGLKIFLVLNITNLVFKFIIFLAIIKSLSFLLAYLFFTNF